jgi:hypothetical protein
VLSERWRCRPSQADQEPAIWVLRQRSADSVRETYRQLAETDLEDDD